MPAVEQIIAARKANKNEKVFLLGFSRGALAALLVARVLEKRDIHVNFLGIIDPVYSGVPLKDIKMLFEGEVTPRIPIFSNQISTKGLLPKSVDSAYVVYTTGQKRTGPTANDSGQYPLGAERWYVENFQRLQIEDPKRKNVWFKTYKDVGHWDVSYNTYVRKYFWDRAVAAGVPLGKNPYNFPWRFDDW